MGSALLLGLWLCGKPQKAKWTVVCELTKGNINVRLLFNF
jgi:hypothetical protein